MAKELQNLQCLASWLQEEGNERMICGVLEKYVIIPPDDGTANIIEPVVEIVELAGEQGDQPQEIKTGVIE